jgi:hypothetical protein
MSKPVIGIEAVSGGALTRGTLRWNYSRLHPGIYLPNDAEQTLFTRTYAAWLWTGRQAVIAGRAAAALHGAQWVDANTPIELITRHGRRQAGIVVRQERHRPDELDRIAGMPVTSAAPRLWTWPVTCRAISRSPTSTRCPRRPASPTTMPQPSRTDIPEHGECAERERLSH